MHGLLIAKVKKILGALKLRIKERLGGVSFHLDNFSIISISLADAILHPYCNVFELVP